MTDDRRTSLSTPVRCVTRIDPVHLTGRLDFLFSPGALENAPVIFYGSVRVRPDNVGPLQVALYRNYPTVTVLNLADVLAIVQEVVEQISVVVRFISAFAILAGAIILASSIAGTRWRRMREVVILKTLGIHAAADRPDFLGGVSDPRSRGGDHGQPAGHCVLEPRAQAVPENGVAIDMARAPVIDLRDRSHRERRRLDGQLSYPRPEAAGNPAGRVISSRR